MRFYEIIRNTVAVMACALNLHVVPVFAAEQFVSKADVEFAANAGDFEQAYSLLVQLAESGNAQAQGFLAYVLSEGDWGVPIDKAASKQWMLRAIEQGDAYANLYVALLNESPTEIDDSDYVVEDWKKHIEIAAEAGHPYAQHLMGNWAKDVYDYDAAIDWYNKAAQPDRGYYFVDYFITMSLYTWPRRFLLNDIEQFVDSGNPRGFSILHAANALGLGTRPYYHDAYEYGVISLVFDEPLSAKATKLVLKNTTEAERQEILKTANQTMVSFLSNPKTYMGQAYLWCGRKQDSSISCLKHSVERHRVCENPYVLWGFQNFTDYSAYNQCRMNLQQSEQ